MTNKDIYRIAINQLSVDYNCTPDDFFKNGVIFTEAKRQEGRREMPFLEPRLEVITLGRSVIVNASKSIMSYVKGRFEGKSRYEILTDSLVYGVNPYYLPDIEKISSVDNQKFAFQLIDTNITKYYVLEGFDNALQYNINSKRPEMLAAVAFDNKKIAGIACASADSKTMWQICVDVLPEYRGHEIAVKLVNMLTIKTLERGIVPYYTTDCGNVSSQRVAVKCGYIPAWSHCFRARLNNI